MGDRDRFLLEYEELRVRRLLEAEERVRYWRAITPERLLAEARKSEGYRDIEKLAKLTGLKIGEVVGNDYGLVVDRDHELFGKVGIHHHSGSSGREFYQFGGKIVGFDEKQVFWARNISLLLEERDSLEKLF